MERYSSAICDSLIALGAQRLHLFDDEGRFLEIGGRFVQPQRFAAALGGPQVLAQTLAVVADQRVGRVQDVALAAVVLLQLDHAALGELALEVEHVARGGAAESVDRLIVVADREDRVVAACQQLEPPILQPVGVLELVHQDVREALR